MSNETDLRSALEVDPDIDEADVETYLDRSIVGGKRRVRNRRAVSGGVAAVVVALVVGAVALAGRPDKATPVERPDAPDGVVRNVDRTKLPDKIFGVVGDSAHEKVVSYSSRSQSSSEYAEWFSRPQSEIYSVSYSERAHLLAVAYVDNSIKQESNAELQVTNTGWTLIDTTSRQVVGEKIDGTVQVAFSPDGKRIIRLVFDPVGDDFAVISTPEDPFATEPLDVHGIVQEVAWAQNGMPIIETSAGIGSYDLYEAGGGKDLVFHADLQVAGNDETYLTIGQLADGSYVLNHHSDSNSLSDAVKVKKGETKVSIFAASYTAYAVDPSGTYVLMGRSQTSNTNGGRKLVRPEVSIGDDKPLRLFTDDVKMSRIAW